MAGKIILICLIFQQFCSQGYAQWGCTDPQANNYDVQAVLNDGSCVYSPTNYTPALLQNLSPLLVENSGVISWNGFLWTINDSGSQPEIVQLDLFGNVLDTILVLNSTNVDWEAITQSETDIFIGDFGNNSGNRHDLSIYQISKQALNTTTNSAVNAQKRVFAYSDQDTFNLPVNGHSFDAEGFYFDQDSLVLLSKNWNDLYTKRYRFPAIWNDSDTLSIAPFDSMFVDGLITDVTFDKNTRRAIALGYKNNGSNFYTSFVYLLFDYPGSNLFHGNKRRVEIGNMLSLSQTEGIAFFDSVSGFITAEQISSVITIDPKLFSFDFSSFWNNVSSSDEMSPDIIIAFPNPVDDLILFPQTVQGPLRLLDVQGKIIMNSPYFEGSELDVSTLLPGMYFLFLGNQRLPVLLK